MNHKTTTLAAAALLAAGTATSAAPGGVQESNSAASTPKIVLQVDDFGRLLPNPSLSDDLTTVEPQEEELIAGTNVGNCVNNGQCVMQA